MLPSSTLLPWDQVFALLGPPVLELEKKTQWRPGFMWMLEIWTPVLNFLQQVLLTTEQFFLCPNIRILPCSLTFRTQLSFHCVIPILHLGYSSASCLCPVSPCAYLCQITYHPILEVLLINQPPTLGCTALKARIMF